MYERLIVLLVRTLTILFQKICFGCRKEGRGIRTICTASLSWRQERRKDRLK
jgi:hypothetical protein